MYRSVAVLVCLVLVQSQAARTRPRIVGGSQTTIQNHPYLVSIRKDGGHICGGSIVGRRKIVTAAHCVVGTRFSDLEIRAGSTYRSRGGTIIKASGWKRHPKFNTNTMVYDLALIYLKQNLTYSNSIRPIKLNDRKLTAKNTAIAMGWGTVAESGNLSEVLKQTRLPVQSRRTCLQVWRNLNVSLFCVGRMRGGTDTCQGDSGGPIVVNGLLAGITSNGNGCGRDGWPGLYTRVNFLRKWINNN